MKKYFQYLVLLFLFGQSLIGLADNNTLHIGLYYKNEPSHIQFNTVFGEYEVFGDDEVILTLPKGSVIQVLVNQNKVNLKSDGKIIGTFHKIFFKRTSWGALFKIQSIAPKLADKEYFDNLTIRSTGKKLKLINHAYIEHYVQGVIESESGSKQNLEYYKVQAIICRTYALANKKRHVADGYQLCDKVHCQVYNSRSKSNPDIIKASNQTVGVVIVDSDINLITAGFHSNCGGQTVNSEHAWKYPVSYLKSVCDTFCSAMPHAVWQKEIPKEQWLSYLEKKYKYPLTDSLFMYCALEHEPDDRVLALNYLDSTILLTEIRRDWELKSTYFFMYEKNDTIYFQGRGFGHGIGLCQEGAMKMSELGYLYNEILHFYYKDIHLVNLSIIDFFKD
jgi:stage II sporulation protein D